jgi:hypothetical protein
MRMDGSIWNSGMLDCSEGENGEMILIWNSGTLERKRRAYWRCGAEIGMI